MLIGGTSAISEQVEDFLAALPTHSCEGGGGFEDDETITVDRVAGADRYATAKAVAEKSGLDEAGTAGSGLDGEDCDDVKTAIVASGENFPDALAAGGLAYGGVLGLRQTAALPMLLTPKSSLSRTASGAIDDLDIEQVILVGGTSAVDAAVETALEALPGVSVVRVAGADRQATAVAIAERILGPANFGDWDSRRLPRGPSGHLPGRPRGLVAQRQQRLADVPGRLDDEPRLHDGLRHRRVPDERARPRHRGRRNLRPGGLGRGPRWPPPSPASC